MVHRLIRVDFAARYHHLRLTNPGPRHAHCLCGAHARVQDYGAAVRWMHQHRADPVATPRVLAFRSVMAKMAAAATEAALLDAHGTMSQLDADWLRLHGIA